MPTPTYSGTNLWHSARRLSRTATKYSYWSMLNRLSSLFSWKGRSMRNKKGWIRKIDIRSICGWCRELCAFSEAKRSAGYWKVTYIRQNIFSLRIRVAHTLRSKRFRRLFRTFEVFFTLWPCENWDEGKEQRASDFEVHLIWLEILLVTQKLMK